LSGIRTDDPSVWVREDITVTSYFINNLRHLNIATP
jgi:hypothetical protein